MKDNILQLTGNFMQGGSERQAVQLTKLLHEEGSYRIFVGCLDYAGQLRLEVEKLGLSEIPEFRLTSFYDANFLRQVRRCSNFIRANKIKLVHTHDFYTNIFGMLAARVSLVPVRIASKRETLSKSKSQLLIERQAFRLADKITANAEAVKRFLVETGVSREKIVTVYNGVDLDRMRDNQNVKHAEILRSVGLSPDSQLRFVTIVTNLRSDVKNHRMFLRAAQQVRERVKSVGFLVVGQGELTESMQNFAKELNIDKDVFFIGGRTDVGDLLSISEVCVLSSKSEGFSNSILEYMAASKPIVATRVGGASEAIIEGESGFLVESEDDHAMAARIIELLNNSEKAKCLGLRGRQIVEEKFTQKAQLTGTLELYNELMFKKAKRI